MTNPLPLPLPILEPGPGLALSVPALAPDTPPRASAALPLPFDTPWPDLASLLLALAPSSRLAYAMQLRQWQAYVKRKRLSWQAAWSRQALTAWCCDRAEQGLKPRTIQQGLYAVRYAAQELHYAGYLSADVEATIRQTKPGWGAKHKGDVTGQWLDQRQVRQLLIEVKRSTSLTARRDAALITLLVGCGLRRMEAASLTGMQFVEREGRHVLADVRGKHGRVRTVPVPGWGAAIIQAWLDAADMTDPTGRLLSDPLLVAVQHNFVPSASSAAYLGSGQPVMGHTWKLTSRRLSPSSLWKIVIKYTKRVGIARVTPHDLRRTFARLAFDGGAPIDQIQAALGHDSAAVTARYIGARLNLRRAACDTLGVD